MRRLPPPAGACLMPSRGCRHMPGQQGYEGEAGARLEAIVDEHALRHEDESRAYPFTIATLRPSGLPCIEPKPLVDRDSRYPHPRNAAGVISARFHRGLRVQLSPWRKNCRGTVDARRRASIPLRLPAAASTTRRCWARRRGCCVRRALLSLRARACPPATAASRLARRRSPPRNSWEDRQVYRDPGPHHQDRRCRRLLATVDIGGIKRQVNIACIVDDEHSAEACVGDWALIDVGFAMSRIHEAEAAATLQILSELGEAQAKWRPCRPPREVHHEIRR